MAECQVKFRWQYHAGDAFKSAHRAAASMVDGAVFQTGGWVAARERTEVLTVTVTDLESGKREDDAAASSDAAPPDRAGTCTRACCMVVPALAWRVGGVSACMVWV